MINQVKRQLKLYEPRWQTLTKDQTWSQLVKKPTAVGWKAGNGKDFLEIFTTLLPFAHQAHVGEVDKRFIASLVLKEPLKLSGMTLRVIKVLERRPGSKDPLGLDHVDFLVDNINKTAQALKRAGVAYELESNVAHQWLSVRFAGTEAKLVDHSVIDVCIAELKEVKV